MECAVPINHSGCINQIKYTCSSHPDRVTLLMALARYEGIANFLNESKRQQEQKAVVQNLAAKISHWPSLQAEEVVVSAGYCPQTGEWVGRGWASPWAMFGILLYRCTEITVLLYSGF